MDKVKNILANILDADVSENTGVDNTETWDSFNHLMIISELEKALGINFTMDEVKEIKSYKDLIKTIERKQ